MTTEAVSSQTRSPAYFALRRGLRNPGLVLSGSVLVLIVALAICAPLIGSHDPFQQDLLARSKPPVFMGGTWAYPLGTDALGRDFLARLLYGLRVSLFIGVSAALVSGLIGGTMGIVAGYFGGRVGACIQFMINVRLALPVVLVALAVVSLFGSSLVTIAIVLGFLLWDRYAVVLRSATMQVRSLEFIAAAETLGTPTKRILIKDILPNVASQLIVIATIEMAHAVMLEAALSFLGLGVRPPTPSLGLMVSEGKEMLLFDSWMITIPGLVIFVLVLAINMFGDGIRDITTPGGSN